MDGTDDVTQIVITPGGMTLADWRAIYEGAAARLTAPAWDAIDASAAAVARIVARGERRAMLVGKLLGVELDRQATRGGGGEHPFGLRGREADIFAKGVDGIGESFGRDRGQYLLAQQGDIAVGVAHKFTRQGMGAEKTGGNTDRQFTFQLPCDPEHAAFGFGFQPVS